MERLGHLIEEFMEQGRWKLLRLSKRRSTLTHLFFVDDIFLFGEVDRGKGCLINDLFNTFYHFLGQKLRGVSPKYSFLLMILLIE